MSKLKIIWLILKERKHQDKIWGTQHDRKHTPGEWCDILEDYCSKYQFANGYAEDRKRLIQIAAICIAALEVD